MLTQKKLNGRSRNGYQRPHWGELLISICPSIDSENKPIYPGLFSVQYLRQTTIPQRYPHSQTRRATMRFEQLLRMITWHWTSDSHMPSHDSENESGFTAESHHKAAMGKNYQNTRYTQLRCLQTCYCKYMNKKKRGRRNGVGL